jgi:hypothetical protein
MGKDEGRNGENQNGNVAQERGKEERRNGETRNEDVAWVGPDLRSRPVAGEEKVGGPHRFGKPARPGWSVAGFFLIGQSELSSIYVAFRGRCNFFPDLTPM